MQPQQTCEANLCPKDRPDLAYLVSRTPFDDEKDGDTKYFWINIGVI